MRKVFKDGLVYGKLVNVELTSDVDPDGKKVQCWVFTGEFNKGNVHSEGEAVMIERKFYIPADVTKAVEFSNEVGWNQKPGADMAKFTKPDVSCRATFIAANRGKNGRDYPAKNDFGEMFAVVTDDDLAKALESTFGKAGKPAK